MSDSCKIYCGGQRYTVSMSDVTNYEIKDRQDLIVYTVDLANQVIHAEIQNPSQHTLYLISQGRCSIAINYKRMKPNSAMGYHWSGYFWPGADHRAKSHTSGFGRSRYRFHRHWSIAYNKAIKVTDYTDIEIPFTYSNSWSGTINFLYCNYYLKWWSDHYQDPELDEFYFDIRLSLLSNQTPQAWIQNYNGAELQRTYQSKSKITRLTFQAL